MIALNELSQQKCKSKAILEKYLVVLAPFAPHITEELWHALGYDTTICDAEWPAFNEEYLKESTVKIAVSFNGKARYTIDVAADASKEEVEKAALSHELAAKWIDGKTIRKVIVVPGKIVNVVV